MLIADDLSGVGAADDVLLVFVGIGLLAVQMATASATPPAELAAWTEVTAALAEVGQAASRALPRRTGGPPRRSNCTAHLIGCLGTRLGNRNTGRVQGHSICSDCFEICAKDRGWPDFVWNGKDCRWWMLP